MPLLPSVNQIDPSDPVAISRKTPTKSIFIMIEDPNSVWEGEASLLPGFSTLFKRDIPGKGADATPEQ